MESLGYRFSFGPWNISEGADPFGPEVRKAYPHEAKYTLYKKLGFDGVQFHDDDVVPGLDDVNASQIGSKAAAVAAILKNEGLSAEFVAPRLWFASQTIDGGLHLQQRKRSAVCLGANHKNNRYRTSHRMQGNCALAGP